MKTESLVILGLLAVAGWFAWRELSPAGRQATAQQDLRSRLASLPRELSLAERRRIAESQGVGAVEGTVAGAQAGAIGGPWGIAIGAGGGFIASNFM